MAGLVATVTSIAALAIDRIFISQHEGSSRTANVLAAAAAVISIVTAGLTVLALARWQIPFALTMASLVLLLVALTAVLSRAVVVAFRRARSKPDDGDRS